MKFSAVKALLVVCLGGALVGAFAAPALAHDSLEGSTPAKNSVVSSLDQIELRFSAHVSFPVVILHDAAGRRFESGAARVDGQKVYEKVAGPLPSGNYVIAWRIVSSDGHPVEGEIPFTVQAASGGAPAASPAATPVASPAAATAPAANSGSGGDLGSGVSVLVWGGVALVVIAVIAALFGRRGKKASGGHDAA
ncbi:hypothetical protein Pth03_36510 [Planotetraspora thailandica]|uniref:CopC domain-containing protein n=1 Tax=Planotetraspora thailandica TaxID=487172 RepID=A0A8J3V0X9_9ACTN|nr:copper resistance CopC family protein [Planotetraspora thailandica]GII55262.1 hypothetical protein Pth03_36510 [Planotetraspora thailandica]